MNQNGSIRVDGVVCFHSLSEWTRLERLKEGLTDAGFAKFVPAARSPSTCLVDALANEFPKTIFRVEKLLAEDSWEVSRIVRGEDANDYPVQHVVRLRADAGGAPQILVGPYDAEVAEKLVSSFNALIGVVRTAQVTGAMNNILKSLGGTSLRPHGSVYWLPGHQVETWEKVCHAVEAAAVGSSCCYMIRHEMDADALRAVRDAIVAEVKAETSRIEAEIDSGELGDRAIERRKDQAQALREKIMVYEETLHVALTELHEVVDKAEGAAMAAAMMCAVAAGVK